MDSKLRSFWEQLTTAIALMLLISIALQVRAQNRTGVEQSDTRWARLSVQLPTSVTMFPAGDGADIANSQCLICHSAGMVLRQPALSESEWRATINKMRTAYGAPLPADQVDALATYLSNLISDPGAG
jgi:mono/diheme cytochrome c family protein